MYYIIKYHVCILKYCGNTRTHGVNPNSYFSSQLGRPPAHKIVGLYVVALLINYYAKERAPFRAHLGILALASFTSLVKFQITLYGLASSSLGDYSIKPLFRYSAVNFAFMDILSGTCGNHEVQCI